MLALYLIPALLGMALIFGLNDEDPAEDPDSPDRLPVDVPDDVAVFDGTDASEYITSRAAGGTVNGMGGSDFLEGSDAADTLDGGSGDDAIYALGGNDQVQGGTGNDRIFLGDGDDLSGPLDLDALAALNEAGLENMNFADFLDDPDRLTAGDDLIRGGAGQDAIIDLRGSNQLFGDTGGDALVALDRQGSNAPDTLDGGFGPDTLIGDDGDVMIGGAGRDTFVVEHIVAEAQEVVRIEDFDPDFDLLDVFIDGPNPDDNIVEFDFDPETALVRAWVAGQQVAVLAGLTAADIPRIESTLTLS